MRKYVAAIWLLITLALPSYSQIKLLEDTAIDVAIGPFVNSSNVVQTGLTLSQADIRLKKNAGSWAQKNQSSSCTHEENGWYECSLNTTDTDTVGTLIVNVNETGALPVWVYFEVVPQASYDHVLGGDVASIPDIWAELCSSIVTSNSIGKILCDNVNVKIGTGAGLLRTGTAQAGTSSTITLDTNASSLDDFYNNAAVSIVGGTGEGQSRLIFDYVGSTRVATVDRTWGTAPDSTSIFALHRASVGDILTAAIGANQIAAGAIGESEIAAGAITSSEFDQTAADKVWSTTTRRVSDATNITSNGAAVVLHSDNKVLLAGTTHTNAELTKLDIAVSTRLAAVRTGTAQAGTTSTITLDASASAINEFYRGNILIITSGTGVGQTAIIRSYVGSTKVATVAVYGTSTTLWHTTPDSTSVFMIVPAR